MKKCHTIEKKLAAYIHGELNERDVQTLEAHLDTCEACRTELKTLRATPALLGTTLDVAPAPEQLSPWQKSVIRPRSIIEKILFSVQLKAVLSAGAIHSMLFLLAGMLVVFTVVKKSEVYFEPPKAIERPKMKLKKPKVRVAKNAMPKATTRIVTSSKSTSMPDIQLPEVSGIGSGLAGESIDGFDMMPDFQEVSVFGSASTVAADPEPASSDKRIADRRKNPFPLTYRFDGTISTERKRRNSGYSSVPRKRILDQPYLSPFLLIIRF